MKDNFLKKLVKMICCKKKPFENVLSGVVSKIIDGDTIKLYAAGKTKKVRLYGIDCPEKHQSHYNESKTALSRMICNEMIKVYYKRHGWFGRIIGKVYCNDIYINLEMIITGNAWHYYKYAKHDEDLFIAQKYAQSSKYGIWATENPIEPWEWRKGIRITCKSPGLSNSFWLNLNTNTRHNSKCRFYKNSKGKSCSPDAGNPCKFCKG